MATVRVGATRGELGAEDTSVGLKGTSAGGGGDSSAGSMVAELFQRYTEKLN